MFVKFSCDCKGFRVQDADGHLQVFVLDNVHDRDGCGCGFMEDWNGCHAEKTYTPLSPLEVRLLTTKLNQLIGQGYRYRDIRGLLEIKD